MTGAFIPSIEIDSLGNNLILKMQVLFFGAGLKDLSEVSISILPTETLAQIKTKLVNAITAEAINLGYSIPPANMIIPAFQKGA